MQGKHLQSCSFVLRAAGPAKTAPAAKKGAQAAPDPYAAGPDSDEDVGGGGKGGRGKKGGGKGKGRRAGGGGGGAGAKSGRGAAAGDPAREAEATGGRQGQKAGGTKAASTDAATAARLLSLEALTGKASPGVATWSLRFGFRVRAYSVVSNSIKALRGLVSAVHACL